MVYLFMDLINAKNVLKEFFTELNFKNQIDVYDTYIQGKAPNVTLKGIDDNIGVSIAVFENNSIGIEFIFDKLSKLEKAASIINHINQKYIYIKAYVNSNGYFCVSYTSFMVPSIDILKRAIYAVFNIVGSDEFISDIQKITKLTK